MSKRTKCATKDDAYKKFSGSEFTLTSGSNRKKDVNDYLKKYKANMKKQGIKYRVIKKGKCHLLYTLHPKRK